MESMAKPSLCLRANKSLRQRKSLSIPSLILNQSQRKQFLLLKKNKTEDKQKKEPNSRRFLLLERRKARMNGRSSKKERLSWSRDQSILTQMKKAVIYPIEKFSKT
jgi:hypothetical protein